MQTRLLRLIVLAAVAILGISLNPLTSTTSQALSQAVVRVYVVGYNPNASITVPLAAVPVRLQGDGCVNPNNVFSDTVVTAGDGSATFICGAGATYSIRTDGEGKLGQYYFYSSTPGAVTATIGSTAYMSAYVHVPAPVINSFTAVIGNDGNTYINWQSTGSAYCLASWAGDGSVVLSGRATVDVATPRAYTLKCVNPLDMSTISYVTSAVAPVTPAGASTGSGGGSNNGATPANTTSTTSRSNSKPNTAATATTASASGDANTPSSAKSESSTKSAETKSKPKPVSTTTTSAQTATKTFGLIALVIAALIAIAYFKDKQAFMHKLRELKSQLGSRIRRALGR